MFVLGTAGHIDHGKSALVKALTGMDPDRLAEEKERGMTIDLGFAWIRLPGGQEVGIVDVPGHEHFIKNMLAGVEGVDLALLIIAANEGVMPQTREHLAILDLLGIKNGIAVITKKDLVDEEWLSLIKSDIEELLAPTSMAKAPIVAVSAVTGEGLKELISVLDMLTTKIEPKKDIGRPRLPIDRVFTIAGSGTVVTGTLIGGSLTAGQEVEIVPAGVTTRLRGLQTHKARLNTATPGSRVGANLVGVSTTQTQRGDVLTAPGWLKPTTLLTVQLRLISAAPRNLKHDATVNFHTGTAEAVAKVRLLETEEIPPGGAALAQLLLNKPVALVKGDRFVIRSPEDTLGGGEVIESHAERYRRFRAAVIESLKVKEKGSTEEIVLTTLESKQPVEQSAFLSQLDLPAAAVQPAIETLIRQGQIVSAGQGERLVLFTASGWEQLIRKTTDTLKEYHQKFPTRPGMPKAELSSRLKIAAQPLIVLQKLIDERIAIEEGGAVHLPDHRIRLTKAQQDTVDSYLKALSQNPYSPPTELIPEPDLLNLLIEQDKVVKINEDVVFSTTAYNEMVNKVTAHIKQQGKVTVGEARDMFKTSRKYVLAFLEHLDRIKVTKRVGDERVLYRLKPVI